MHLLNIVFFFYNCNLGEDVLLKLKSSHDILLSSL